MKSGANEYQNVKKRPPRATYRHRRRTDRPADLEGHKLQEALEAHRNTIQIGGVKATSYRRHRQAHLYRYV